MSTKRELSGGMINAGEYSLACPVGRFGQSWRFNGMGKEEEIKGEGNIYDFGARIYDTRNGRWLSIDPVIHEWQSPYCAFDNNPIAIADPSGADGEDPPKGEPQNDVAAIGGTLTLPKNAKVISRYESDTYNTDNLSIHVQKGSVKSFTIDDGTTYTASFNADGSFNGYRSKIFNKLYDGSEVLDDLPIYYWEDTYNSTGVGWYYSTGEIHKSNEAFSEDIVTTRLVQATIAVSVSKFKRLFPISDKVSDILTASVAISKATDITVESRTVYSYINAQKWYGTTAVNIFTGNSYIFPTGTSKPMLIRVGDAYIEYRLLYKGVPIEGAGWKDKISELKMPEIVNPPTSK